MTTPITVARAARGAGVDASPLGSFERAEALTAAHFAFNIAVVVKLSGTLDAEILRSSLNRLQANHPLLRARIGGSVRRPEFVVSDQDEVNAIPLHLVERTHADRWLQVVEDELVKAFDVARGPLLRCLWVVGEGRESDRAPSELVLTFHHVIVDGVSALRVVQELFDLCAGDDSAVEAASTIPSSADELFPGAFRAPRRWPASVAFLARQALEEVTFLWRRRGRDRPGRKRAIGSARPPAASSPCCRVLARSLSQDETTALVRATRRRRVGVFSAVSAALLLAVVEERHGNRAGPYRYFAFPLLRPYLEPPVDDRAVRGYLTTMRLTIGIEPAAGLWPLAGAMHRQVDRAAKRGERYLASVWTPASMRLLLSQSRRMAASALNYAGAIDLEVDPTATFALEGLHAFVTNFMPGPEYTGQARIFARRLWWDLVYLDVDMSAAEAERLADRMIEILAAACGPEGGGSG